jgi:hypothetical protein
MEIRRNRRYQLFMFNKISRPFTRDRSRTFVTATTGGAITFFNWCWFNFTTGVRRSNSILLLHLIPRYILSAILICTSWIFGAERIYFLKILVSCNYPYRSNVLYKTGNRVSPALLVIANCCILAVLKPV